MLMPRVFSIRAMIKFGLPYLAIFLFPLLAVAQSNNSNYIFLLASGFVCDAGDSSTCPAAAKSMQGDSYELSGAGIFDAQNKSVKAAGTYTYKSANGNVLETGVWLATELVSFDSYGIAPGALRQRGVALGPLTQNVCQCPLAPCRQAVSRYFVSASCRCRDQAKQRCCK